jgi:hypothetical protein
MIKSLNYICDKIIIIIILAHLILARILILRADFMRTATVAHEQKYSCHLNVRNF